MLLRPALVVSALLSLLALIAPALHAGDGQDGKKVSPAAQARIDELAKDLAAWCEQPALVDSVLEQNKKGPLPEMSEAKWKETKRRSPLIEGFQKNPAGLFLKQKCDQSSGLLCEAFLSAAQGEKVAFVEKTSSYIHKGKAKFDVPFGTRKTWQGEPTFDESTQTFSVQLSLPVLEPKKSGDDPAAERKPIGVLTVGLNLTQLEESVKGK